MIEEKHNSDHVTHNYLNKLKDGSILLSKEELDDPNFTITIVLICVYNKEGAFGLVCNRPSHMPLGEIFDLDVLLKNEKRKIYIGGPVQQDTLHIIQITDSPVEQAYQIGSRVYLGGEWESIESILSQDPASTRLFLGYSGWAAGQLEFEIEEGAWEVYTIDIERFLSEWEAPLFQDIKDIRKYLKKISLQEK